MPELIDRSKLRNTICAACAERLQCAELGNVCFEVACINSAPTISAEPVKHGRWIKEYQYLYGGEQWVNQYCSLCEIHTRQRIRDGLYKFCPNCGGQMDADANESMFADTFSQCDNCPDWDGVKCKSDCHGCEDGGADNG